MQCGKLTLIMVLVVTICGTLAGISIGQDYKKDDDVIALRDADLKLETKTVGTVSKGDKLSVEDVQGNWLWIRKGETSGWIESTNVIDVALKAWYERQADMASSAGSERASDYRVNEHGEERTKLLGVTVRIVGLKARSHPSILINANGANLVNYWDDGSTISNTENPDKLHILGPDGKQRILPRDGVSIDYGDLMIKVERVDDKGRMYSSPGLFSPSGTFVREAYHRRLFLINDKSYGLVQKGDHVVVDQSRQVFVNGERRISK